MGPALAAMAAAITVALAFAAPAARAAVGYAPEPVCRRSEVLDVVTRELSARIAYVRLDPRNVWEQPTALGNVVRCGVCLGVIVYDMPRLGLAPAIGCQLHRYEVQRVESGYVVSHVD